MSGKHRTVTVTQRAQIIQRVLVDGWSAGEAAEAFAVERRLVEAWVADYRRHGMASLRRTPKKSIPAEMIRLRLSEPAATLYRRLLAALRATVNSAPASRPLPVRRPRGDRHSS